MRGVERERRRTAGLFNYLLYLQQIPPEDATDPSLENHGTDHTGNCLQKSWGTTKASLFSGLISSKSRGKNSSNVGHPPAPTLNNLKPLSQKQALENNELFLERLRHPKWTLGPRASQKDPLLWLQLKTTNLLSRWQSRLKLVPGTHTLGLGTLLFQGWPGMRKSFTKILQGFFFFLFREKYYK